MPFAFGTIMHAQSPDARFAVVISKKSVPTAVERNRLRRRAYAAVRGHVFTQKRATVVYLDKRARGSSFGELKSALTKALS